MRALQTGFALVAIAVLVACTQTINMDGVKSAVSAGITQQLGLAVASVTCPDSREAKANDTFECIVAPQGGGKLTVKVTQTDDEGNVNWEVVKSEGLLDLASLADQIKAGIKAQLNADVSVDCGAGRYRAAEAGKTFECTARDQQGTTAPVTITMKDAEGNISWRVGR